MRYLQNLSSRETLKGKPWDLDHFVIPAEVRTNKKLRDIWINDPSTKHCVYSTWEGLNENARISREGIGKDGTKNEENPPHICHGFIADYDTALTDEEVAAGLNRMAPMLPSYFGRSLSGKVHMVWVFEKPLPITSFALAEKFLELILEKLHLQQALPCLDKAFTNPCQYYTNGCTWYSVNEASITYATALGWFVEASHKINWKAEGYSIPLNAVREQLLKNPKFSEQWNEIEFTVGAQGPTWWIEGSASPKSAIVKETGMFTFSDHAPKNFYFWGDLIGWSFVDQYKASQVGSAVQGIYYDGRQFWREISRGDWKAFTKDDIIHFLRVSRGLKDKISKGEQFSELDLAYEYVIDHHNIEGAAPFVFKPNGLISVNEKPFLNVHTGRVLSPIDHKVEWSHPDHFPWLSQFFGPPSFISDDPALPRFFKGGSIALDTFLSWLAYFYRTAYELKLRSGHNLFLCGPANIGKTFLNREIVGALMNGYREARDYLMGEDVFGAELFSVAHWVVDDGTMSNSLAAHRRWGEMIKRMAANSTFRYHEKFRTPQQVEWQGRAICTLNNDEESARLLPDLERSILDKIGLYRITDVPTVTFFENSKMQEILKRELPHFARFLLDWQTPEQCVLHRPNGTIDWRFGGIKPWHDQQLILHANQSSRTSGFVEILEDWKAEYFEEINAGKSAENRITMWRGSAYQLRKALCANPAAADALRTTDIDDIGRSLSKLKAKGYRIETEDEDDIRYWVIHSKQVPSKHKPAPAQTNSPESKFSKQ